MLRLEVFSPLGLYLNSITGLNIFRKVVLDSPPESVNERFVMFL